MKKYKIIIIIILLQLLYMPVTLAQSKLTINNEQSSIQINDTVELAINISDANIASCTITIYYNNINLEYMSGPENSNNINNSVVYTWVSQSGENARDVESGKFLFKAKEEGKTNIVVIGEYYNSSGEKVDIKNATKELQIGDVEENLKINLDELINETNINKEDTNLSILRLNHEGISPNFSPEIKEYYFIANKEIEKLDVVAIPKNINYYVTITGNENLKIGKNVININVQSEDKTKNSIYKIYVTKTDDIKKANANLENLAIRQADLNPEFEANTTTYKTEVSNNVNKLDILAIPQNQKAVVNILQDSELKIGNNKIKVEVLAEDKITTKIYNIEVYKRNEQEEIQYNEKQKQQVERLAAIIEEKNENDEQDEKDSKNQENNIIKKEFNNSKYFILAGIIIIVFILFLKKKIKK